MSDDTTTSNPEGADGAAPHADMVPSGDSSDTSQHFGVSDVLDAVSKERDEFKDLALRLQADFENFRKRVTTQMVDDVDRATGKLVESILPVLDACEAAAAHGVQGIESVCSARCKDKGLRRSTWPISRSIRRLRKRSYTNPATKAKRVPSSSKCCAPDTAGRVAWFARPW